MKLAESSVTGKRRNRLTHLPAAVEDHLGLEKGDVLEYFSSDHEMPQGKTSIVVTKKT